MAHPVIEADECIACGVCVDDCPQGVLELQDVATVTDEDSCIACGVCEGACPVYAGGDAVTGAATVILAMGAGKLGAKSIDEYIKSKG